MLVAEKAVEETYVDGFVDFVSLSQSGLVGLVDYPDDDEDDEEDEDSDSKEGSPPLSKKSKLSS